MTNSESLSNSEKVAKIEHALRRERDTLRREGGHLLVANAITSYLQNADEDSKVRFFDILTAPTDEED